MNLVRAISLGGVGGDLRGNDSTGLICHVQLCLLAIDWILNILADNFLRDPLGLLIIFILQVFLLIIGLIFYLMSSANQAMKQGIHQKLLRHHQVTIVMWTIYFSMLIWWYIWALKRSWPSAGEHFSFIFSGAPRTPDFSSQLVDSATEDDDSASSTTTQRINDSVVETILGTTFRSVLTSSPPETLSLTTPSSSGVEDGSATTSNPSDFMSSPANLMIGRSGIQKQNSSAIGAIIANAPLLLNEILKAKAKSSPQNVLSASLLISPQLQLQQQQLSISSLNPNSTNHQPGLNSEGELIKLFWSPGFIAVYAIERSISLLFYVAYILGTLHIINAHLIDDEDKDDIFQNPSNMSNSYNMNDLSSRRKSSSHGFRNKSNNIGGAKTSLFMYESATSRPFQIHSGREHGHFIESDSNVDMDDNFIRQLEDQDGDPFENEQYEYQYQYKKPGQAHIIRQGTNSGSGRRDRRHQSIPPPLDDSDTDEAENIRRNISDGKNKPPKYLKSKRSKSARKSSINRLEKTKGALRSMMVMSNLGNNFPSTTNNNNNTGAVVVGGNPKIKVMDMEENANNSNSGIYMTQSSVTLGLGNNKSFSPPENRNSNRNNATTATIVTASTSIDTICTGSGSTDELLVAEVYTRGTGNNNNGGGLQGIDGFVDNNDNYTDTEDSDDEDGYRLQNKQRNNRFEMSRADSESALRANLSHFTPKDEKAFTKRKM